MIKKVDVVMIINASLVAIIVALALMLASCGEGGISASGPTATISGAANSSTASLKPGVRAVSSSAIGGSTVTATDATTGNVCALSTCTTTTSNDPNSLGQFTLTVPGNNTYVITVSSMRAIMTVGTGSGPQVTVNPASEAAVQILETKNLNVPAGTLGKKGHKFDQTISGVDVNGEIQAINNSGEPTSVAQAVLTALESCLPPGGAAGVQNALSHIQAHHGSDNNHGNGHGNGHNSDTGTSSSTGTDTGTSSGTSTTTTSGTGTATGTGSDDGLDSGNDHFCHRGGSGTGTGSNTNTGTTSGTDTGTGSNTSTSTSSSTDTGTGSNTSTSTSSSTDTGTSSNTSTTSSTGTTTGSKVSIS